MKFEFKDIFEGFPSIVYVKNRQGVYQYVNQAREELQTNYEKLEKLNTELDHLVYRTSHDLRTPVASLLGLLEMLRLGDYPDPKKYHDIFAGQLNRLDLIINDIINYRKIAKNW